MLVHEPVHHKAYTIKHKRTTVCDVDELVASGLTLSSACDHAGVARRLFYKWKKLLETAQQAANKKYAGHLRTLHKGRASILAP